MKSVSSFISTLICIKISILSFLLIYSTEVNATINMGGIMIIGFDGDNPDYLVFAVLEDLPPGEQFYITDNEWNGSSFDTGEGVVQWTNDTGSIITAGIIISLNVTTLTFDLGSATSIATTLSLTTSGDDIYLYQGGDGISTPTNFITAFSSGPDPVATLSGTGLTDGLNAISTAHFNNLDVILYSGSLNCAGLDLDGCAAMFANPANFTSQDGSGDQSTDNIFPDIPDDTPAGFMPPTVLPIKLLYFEASLSDNSDVNIRWANASEIMSDHMIIEHKGPEDHKFAELYRVQSRSSSQASLHEYTYLHQKPRPGNNYYRLKQVDLDGSISTFDISVVPVYLSNKDVKLAANRIMDDLTLELGNINTDRLHYYIVDYTGALLKKGIIAEKVSDVSINCQSLVSGHYFLLVETSLNRIESFPFVKL